jgi:arabinose-5-phosphate isomerase
MNTASRQQAGGESPDPTGRADGKGEAHAAVRPDKIIQTGRRVVSAECAALVSLADSLDHWFDSAVRLILGLRGRVVVSGIGKSGHIGHKIAATLASTGTPAMFVHPTEANHGDLGMVTADDALLLISNSGEATELLGMINYAARFSIPVIAITRAPDSTLARAARIVLPIPSMPEACAIGFAPTTSTACTLALGDALAIALMEVRDFGAEEFKTYHPGGPLGARLLKVGDLMHGTNELPLVHGSTPMTDALLTMTSHGFGILGVVAAEAPLLIGVVSDGDLRRHMEGLLTKNVSEVMTTKPRTTSTSTLATEALALMNAHKITCLFVIDTVGHVMGLIHVHDCLRAGIDFAPAV